MDRRIYDHPHRRFERGAALTLSFDGQQIRAYEGEPLAVALFASGIKALSRSIKYHRPRAFFCLEGHCGACLMRVDGVPNLRACVEPCREGLEAQGQNGFPSTEVDLLGAADWFFPHGMDHHTLMVRPKILNSVMQKVVRKLSGLGERPDTTPPASEYKAVRRREVDVLVVGAGPAGLAAAEAAARTGVRVLCVDEQDRAGGSLLADPAYGMHDADARVGAARAAGVELLARSTVLAFYPEDDGGLVAIDTPEGLLRVRARRYVYATGAYDVNALFEDNDRPGVFSARAVGRLLVRWGVTPGNRVVVAGDTDYARRLTAELEALHVHTTRVDRVLRAHGLSWINAVDVQDPDGTVRRVECDALAVAETPSPASEGPRQHDCAVRLGGDTGGFAVIVDDAGHTDRADVLACGDVTGFVGPTQAAAHGARVGRVAGEEARS